MLFSVTCGTERSAPAGPLYRARLGVSAHAEGPATGRRPHAVAQKGSRIETIPLWFALRKLVAAICTPAPRVNPRCSHKGSRPTSNPGVRKTSVCPEFSPFGQVVRLTSNSGQTCSATRYWKAVLEVIGVPSRSNAPSGIRDAIVPCTSKAPHPFPNAIVGVKIACRALLSWLPVGALAPTNAVRI